MTEINNSSCHYKLPKDNRDLPTSIDENILLSKIQKILKTPVVHRGLTFAIPSFTDIGDLLIKKEKTQHIIIKTSKISELDECLTNFKIDF